VEHQEHRQAGKQAGTQAGKRAHTGRQTGEQVKQKQGSSQPTHANQHHTQACVWAKRTDRTSRRNAVNSLQRFVCALDRQPPSSPAAAAPPHTSRAHLCIPIVNPPFSRRSTPTVSPPLDVLPASSPYPSRRLWRIALAEVVVVPAAPHAVGVLQPERRRPGPRGQVDPQLRMPRAELSEQGDHGAEVAQRGRVGALVAVVVVVVVVVV
jgi:hypothetical protein